MNASLAKIAVLGVVAGGFYATGDLPRLIDRGRRIVERTNVPLPAADGPASTTVAAAPSVSEMPFAPPPRFDAPPPAAAPPAPRLPTPPAPAPAPAAAPPIERVAEEPTRIPMPPLALEAIDLASLQPGQRVLLLCGRHVVALDVVDGPAGEVLEHAHTIHTDRTVTIASTAAPRRLVVVGCSAGSARFKARGDRRIVRGEWLHVIPSGGIQAASMSSGGVTTAVETIGPIEAVGLQ